MSNPEQATSFIQTAVTSGVIAAIPYQTQNQPEVVIADVPESEFRILAKSGATVYPDFKFSIFVPEDANGAAARYGEPQDTEALKDAGKDLQDVLNHIRAPKAWRTSRGAGVTIAIVDTGVCPTLKEFPAIKRSPVDLPGSAYSGNQWEDTEGHGSMCATIAAATKSTGGRFDDVAPDATVISARSTLNATDIHIIYDQLISAKKQGRITGPLVISNSYDPGTCSAPEGLPADHPYVGIVVEAVKIGIPVVFAAGNNHWYLQNCKNDPEACTPNTIWAINSHDMVMTVGTVNENNSNQDPSTPHPNSSRGPGQWTRSGTKPDCVAPTYGEVVWGCKYKHKNWWGTSGACPQVAGLAALLLSANPALSPMQIYNIIRRTCKVLAAPATCVGAGLIDCAAAVASAGHA